MIKKVALLCPFTQSKSKKDDGTAKICPVETGVLCGDGVIINQGLHNGDKVIVKGYQKISEGMKVFER